MSGQEEMCLSGKVSGPVCVSVGVVGFATARRHPRSQLPSPAIATSWISVPAGSYAFLLPEFISPLGLQHLRNGVLKWRQFVKIPHNYSLTDSFSDMIS